MFLRFRCGLSECVRLVRCYPAKVFAFPAVLVIASFFIRLFGDGTYTLYLALDGRGIFPSAVIYTLGYLLRLIAAGLSLSAAAFCTGLFEQRGKAIILSAVSCVLLLFEYRLIFVSISVFLEILLCIVTGVAAFFACAAFLRARCCGFFASALLLIMTAIFFVQLLSLLVSL